MIENLAACPVCQSSWIGWEIPEKYRHHNVVGDPYFDPKNETCDAQKARFDGHCYCLAYGDHSDSPLGWHGSRLLGVEYELGHPQHYDGVSEWVCPDCGTRWGRWSHAQLAEGEIEPRYGIVR